MKYFAVHADEALDDLKATKKGLSHAEVDRRLAKFGENTVIVKSSPLWKKILEPFKSIFILILAIAAVISFYHHAVIDAVVILIIIAVNAIIHYIQNYSTEKILRSLRKRSTTKATVIRDGNEHVIDAVKLVPGDIIICIEGDRIPADARVIETSSLRVDESQLTGESMPISKSIKSVGTRSEIYERTSMVYQGSFVIGGTAKAVVTATGGGTEFGKLAKLSSAPRSASPVQKKVDKLITQVIIAVSAIAIVTFLLAIYRGIGVAESLQFVLALTVSAVPESLPIAISVVLALGMRRMAKRKALVRTMDAIENIGSITTIATDKTGTLTKNKLSVHDTWHDTHSKTKVKRALAQSTLPEQASKFQDPLDVAFHEYAGDLLKSEPVRSYQFEHNLTISGNLWHHGDHFLLTLKGAPEKMIERCDLTESERERAHIKLAQMTSSGYRVIALAHAEIADDAKSLQAVAKKTRFEFDGLVAVADILRPEARGAIRQALRAGISVRMITGDHFETAYQIGKELNLAEHRGEVFDCRYLDGLKQNELEKVVLNTKVFARVIPEQKHRILSVLKKHDITAMTGDGVNDVPALTNSHVGIAMGSGSQIAKDAGDIILLDDNFRSIIHAVSEGRIIHTNIKRMMAFLLATNIGEVLIAVGALALGLPLPLSPIQILWINLATDTALAIPLGLEPAEKNNMRNPPYKASAPLLNLFAVSRIVVVALMMAIIALGIYAYFYSIHGADYARTMTFTSVVVMQVASVIGFRSNIDSFVKRLAVKNYALAIGVLCSVGLQALALFTPLSTLLHVSPITLSDLFLVSSIAFIAPLAIIELHRQSFKKYA